MENKKSTEAKGDTIMNKEDFAALWKSIRLKVTDTYDVPPEILWVNGSTIGTLGNFSASTGKAKSKKTFNISAIGADAFSARLDEVFAACGDMSGCAALCIGAAGLSLPQTERIIHRQLELAHFRGVLRLCGDHEIALRGAHIM